MFLGISYNHKLIKMKKLPIVCSILDIMWSGIDITVAKPEATLYFKYNTNYDGSGSALYNLFQPVY